VKRLRATYEELQRRADEVGAMLAKTMPQEVR